MNTAIVLAGGTGERLGENMPKQYLIIGDKPIISYSLETIEKNELIDEIVIVAAEEWRPYILQYTPFLSKLRCFAPAGSSREHSVLLGLEAANPETDIVAILEAARPNTSDELITNTILGIGEDDGAFSVLPMKDTIFYSENGKQISHLLKRDCLFAGHSPECYRFKKFFAAHDGMTEEELSTVRGSAELAFRHGFRINFVKGDERNYKITTNQDLVKFKLEVDAR